MAHKAFIAKVEQTVQIEGANTVQMAVVLGTQIIVGKDVKVGDVGVFFPSELQLSKDYCRENNLFRDSSLNKNNEKAGFFEPSCRVRPQKFLKIKSDGYFAPVESLAYTGYDLNKLTLGTEFDTLGDVKICEKYFSQAARRALQNNRKNALKKVKVVEAPTFREHVDTENFAYYSRSIPKGALITIDAKTHGCVERETLVETKEYGEMTIGEIVDKKISVHILSYDIHAGEDVFAKVASHYFLQNDGEWYELELEDGRKLVITGNNPVWLPDLLCYRRCDKLKVGDFLTVRS